MGTKKMKLQLKIVFRINFPHHANVYKFSQVCGALSPLTYGFKLYNLTNFKGLLAVVWTDFPELAMSKVEEKLEESIQNIYERKHIGVDHKITRKI